MDPSIIFFMFIVAISINVTFITLMSMFSFISRTFKILCVLLIILFICNIFEHAYEQLV
jgi:hypothetical protein